LERPSRDIAGQAGQSGQTPASAPGVVERVRGLLLQALKNKASDIHIQPMANSLVVRFRIDGQLQTLLTLDKDMLAPVISHLKLVSSLDFAEKRRPQDGRVSLEHEGRSHDFRLSIVPGVFGEKAVIRAVGSSDKRVTPLHQLG
ncbi:ATPase, T2SS/T4P/T4SS family, partial [Leptospira sp. SA-E8]|uniref:ATPase, T2SS/T4P/T4SS family n=1 Tax=Leptospira sp. SA-E8 TaxID=3422259 RepID=UPI003EB80FA4